MEEGEKKKRKEKRNQCQKIPNSASGFCRCVYIPPDSQLGPGGRQLHKGGVDERQPLMRKNVKSAELKVTIILTLLWCDYIMS